MKKTLLAATLLIAFYYQPKAQSLTKAQQDLTYQRYESAFKELTVLLHTNPDDAQAWWLLTRVMLHDHRVQAAHDMLLLLPAATSQQPFALCAYGAVLLEQQKKDSAATLFTKALTDTKEKDPMILLAVATAHQEADSGDANYAIELLNKAIKRDKHTPGLYVALGNAYRKLMDGTNSYKAYQDALALDDRNVDAMYRLGKIFVTQDNPEMYLKYFNDAVAADSTFAPAWFELYYHYYFHDVNKAMEYLNHYIANDDPGIKNDYLVTDLLYSSRQYQSAIDHARHLIGQQAGKSEPRLYKLIAYSYKELHDSTKALDYMKQYFQQQPDSGFVVKDYSTMAEIYDELHQPDSAIAYYIKAGNLEKDSLQQRNYAKKLAGLYKGQKDYSNQAIWLGRYYQGNDRATNLDLFNWGLAHYMAKEFPLADTVFTLYVSKYPDQCFGYYWRARSAAAIDTTMTGLAIPDYLKIVDIDSKDSTEKTNRKHLIESYGYIAAYKANTQKDYAGAIDYFQRLLALDPENSDAQRYIGILKKSLSKSAQASAGASSDNGGR